MNTRSSATSASKLRQPRDLNHGSKEYAPGNVNTNTIEGVFSIFIRGMTGVYQHAQSSTCTAIGPSSIYAITIASR